MGPLLREQVGTALNGPGRKWCAWHFLERNWLLLEDSGYWEDLGIQHIQLVSLSGSSSCAQSWHLRIQTKNAHVMLVS